MDFIKETKTLEERGIEKDSFFTVLFNGMEVTEHLINWSSISSMQEIIYPNGIKKNYYVSTIPVKKLKVNHNALAGEFDIGENERCYQAICQRLTYTTDGRTMKACSGRIFGVVDSNNKVLRELFLNAQTNEAVGLNYV